MLIYLDTMIVQYIADNQDYVFQDITSISEIPNPAHELKFACELEALRRLVFLEQYGQWDFAAPLHLKDELMAGKPTEEQLKTYRILLQAWEESGWLENSNPSEEKVSSIEHLLFPLKYKDKADRRHIAEAMALGAAWFITNDKNIIKTTRQKKRELLELSDENMLNNPQLTANQILERLLNITVIAKPSECVKKLDSVVVTLHR